MTKRAAFIIALLLSLLAFGSASASVFAKDNWTSVRSKNFLLVGNASEKDIREVATRLEQFREVFSRLFTNLNINSPVPTTVIVFKNHDSYRPFQLNARNAGYFQSGPDVNYIALKLIKDPGTVQDPYTIIFHEYTHLLIRTATGNVPLWFNEGMAEYYSTFSITDAQKVVMGKPISSHVYLLRERNMLPLRTLFQVDSKSPYYNEGEKQSIFYAESWALMHYLMLGNDGQRMTQLGKFIDLIARNVPMEDAFKQAFSTTFENMEKELHAYIQRDRYPIVSGSFTNKVTYDSTMRSAPITEAEAQAYLGDLLLKSNREDCEVYLQRALALDPELPMANASLGLLRVRQGKPEEARQRLERAVAASSQNYLIHYYYAFALSREGVRDPNTVMGFAPETATKMRVELKRAIELRPDFLESYSLLAFVNLVTATDVDETVEMMKRTLARSPEREDFVFMLAQLYMRKEDFGAARQLIDRLSKSNDPELRQRAAGLRRQLAWMDQQRERTGLNTGPSDSGSSANPVGRDVNGKTIVYDVDPNNILRESLRKPAAGETQAQATLVRIDCDARGITFVVKIADRLRKLNTDSFSHMSLTTFTADAGGQITCGPRKPEDNIVVAYVPTADTRSKVDGVVKSVEFVPHDFKLKP
ncbi:MAG TPA: tetratricopeptide repeat protein [Pyrinomonadaceae bacterium]|nr:tetratricopeptide repeat protein [Pyrinomonadaceae bacterium]